MMMNLQTLKEFLLCCTLINLGCLLWWFGFFVFAHDWMYRMHGRWFKMSVEQFDAIHYAGMAGYKIGVLLFFVIPWLALLIVT